MSTSYSKYAPGNEKVLHGVIMPRELSAKLRMLSMSKSKIEGKHVPMAHIMNEAFEEYFTNHKEEIRKALEEYQANGGILTMMEKEFYE